MTEKALSPPRDHYSCHRERNRFVTRAGEPLLIPAREVAPDVLADTPSTRQQAAWRSWLMGGGRTRLMTKATPKDVKFPTIYKVGHNARQIAFLLSGINVLARLPGYSGLCVLIDEAESYSLLKSQQRPKAGLFFAAMVHAATAATGGHERRQIREDALPQHRLRDYPATYGAGQSLFLSAHWLFFVASLPLTRSAISALILSASRNCSMRSSL
ncbi:MAG: hypothetical protein WD314_02395 [Trueperaceae bacterium]